MTLAAPFGAWSYGSLCFSTSTPTPGGEIIPVVVTDRHSACHGPGTALLCPLRHFSNAHHSPGRKVLFLTLCFQVRRPRLREVERLAEGHTAGGRQISKAGPLSPPASPGRPFEQGSRPTVRVPEFGLRKRRDSGPLRSGPAFTPIKGAKTKHRRRAAGVDSSHGRGSRVLWMPPGGCCGEGVGRETCRYQNSMGTGWKGDFQGLRNWGGQRGGQRAVPAGQAGEAASWGRLFFPGQGSVGGGKCASPGRRSVALPRFSEGHDSEKATAYLVGSEHGFSVRETWFKSPFLPLLAASVSEQLTF